MRRSILCSTLTMLFAFSCLPIVALEDIPKEGGFSGYLVFGGGSGSIETNMIAGSTIVDFGEETILSLGAAPESVDEFLPSLSGELRYTLAARRTQIFFGTTIESPVTLDSSQTLGVRWQGKRAGIVQANLLFSGVATEVWSDPYLVGSPRTRTDQVATGARLVWDRILGTGLEISLSSREFDVDDEQSGVALGLDSSDRDLLRREGSQNLASIGYALRIGDSHILQPRAGFTQNDRDGEAMSNDTVFGQIVYTYRGKRLTLIADALAGERTFDAKNPIFGIEADSSLLSGTLAGFYKLSSSPRGWSIAASATYSEEDSDIDFYDTSALTGFLGLAYNWE